MKNALGSHLQSSRNAEAQILLNTLACSDERMKFQCVYAHYREFEDVFYKHVKTVGELVCGSGSKNY